MLKLNCEKIKNSKKLLRKLSSTTEGQWRQPVGINTGITVYNCVARKKVPLILSNKNYLTWYTCGPTVYDSAHIGHASCYVKFDIIQRILRNHFKYNVVTTMNITDIDDKIIMRSQQDRVPFTEIAKRYESEFWQDMNSLNVLEPNIKVRVSENMPKIIAFIEGLKSKGLAYVAADNSVYFNVQKYENYGKLLHINRAEVERYAGVAQQTGKLNAGDFALWKAAKKGEPAFSAPWGAGRPGWHIECSALASFVYGRHIDIHAGGLDLRFPHHENEEAQSCVHHNCAQWVNYWMHSGSLSLKAQECKMSKSLKNTISIANMLQQYTADEFRMACLLSNYKNNMEYSDELMQLAAHTLRKLQDFKNDCEAYLLGYKITGQSIDSNAILQSLAQAQGQYDGCLRDDFDTAKAISVLFEFTSNISGCINKKDNAVDQLITSSSLDVIAALLNFLENVLETFGFHFIQRKISSNQFNENNFKVQSFVEDLLSLRMEIREAAVASKNKEIFKICDKIRHLMQAAGIDVKDHGKGSTWTFNEKKKI